MLTIKDFSFPTKVTALLLTIILGGGTIYLTYKYVYGSVTITAPQSNAYVFIGNDPAAYYLPYTARLKPGNITLEISAPGYLNKNTTTKVYPFWHSTKKVTFLKDLSYENPNFIIQYDYKKQSYLIIPKINITSDLSPTQQIADEWGEYVADANKALSYIKSQGVDPKSLPIEWWAHEWWPKGKGIQY
jgi:hypothetical protein